MLSIHIELYFFLLRWGTSIQPRMIHNWWWIVKRLENFRPEFISFCEKIQWSEGLLALKCFIFAKSEGDFSKALFIRQVAKGLKYLIALLKLNNQKLSIFLGAGIISDRNSWVYSENGIAILRIDEKAYLFGLTKVDEIQHSSFFVVEQYSEKGVEETLQTPQTFYLQSYLYLHYYYIITRQIGWAR